MIYIVMKRVYTFFLLLFLSIMACGMSAARTDSTMVRLAYDVDFDLNFDNREFARNDFSPSMTIFGARVTPSVGVMVDQPKGLSHIVMLGVDVMKDFGASPVSTDIAGGESPETQPSLMHKNLFGEIVLYYQLHKNFGKTDFSIDAGIFPRKEMETYYSQAFFSDSLKFYDNNLEGVLLKLRRPKAYFELGCDWMGQIGTHRREKFMVFSGGEGKILPFMGIGYSAYMYHFANSGTVRGVVDNILINPYLKFDFSEMTGLQRFSLRAGWIQSMQNDRLNIGHYIMSGGAEAELDIRQWNIGFKNVFYYGGTVMSLYNLEDAGGIKYGNRLYFGDPFYLINDDNTMGIGLYDRAEVYYEPYISDFMKIRVSAAFHFSHVKYAGCQQMVRFIFDLQKLVDRK